MTNRELLELSKPKPPVPQVGDVVVHWKLKDVIVESGVPYSPRIELELLWEMKCTECFQYKVCKISEITECLHRQEGNKKPSERFRLAYGKYPTDLEYVQFVKSERWKKRERISEKDCRKIIRKNPSLWKLNKKQ